MGEAVVAFRTCKPNASQKVHDFTLFMGRPDRFTQHVHSLPKFLVSLSFNVHVS